MGCPTGRSPRRFLSTPSARRATGKEDLVAVIVQFLSTPSARRATLLTVYNALKTGISIHALREEGDGQRRQAQRGHEISIHALREEGDPPHRHRLAAPRDFYPRPPRGGRRGGVRLKDPGGVFLSTPSARRATLGEFLDKFPEEISIHALREEGDIYIEAEKAGTEAFLSTPSARRATTSRLRPVRNGQISIHALREEGDGFCPVTGASLWISIHALREEGDRSSTASRSWTTYFYPRPPRGGRHYQPVQEQHLERYFYPRPPRGGRPVYPQPVECGNEFLSTPSARRATTISPP